MFMLCYMTLLLENTYRLNYYITLLGRIHLSIKSHSYNMVVCKFFLEGYCKYDSGCKFEHVNSYRGYESNRSPDYSSSDRPLGTSILRGANTSSGGQELDHSFSHSQEQNSFSQKPTVGLKFNVQEIMLVVAKDIVQSEKGNQWQLSCYSPLKDLPNIPGLVDNSPEEIRWECYKAWQTGSHSLFQVGVQQLCTNVAKINNELKKKDTGYIIIDRWLRNAEEYMQSPLFVDNNIASPSTSPQQFYSPTGMRPATNSSFSFSLLQQQPVNVHTYPQSASMFENSQTPILHTSNQNLQAFSPGTGYTVIDDQAYSKVEELAEAELESFKADKFVFQAIPTKPPPKSLCNV